jgi:hypothetical protein
MDPDRRFAPSGCSMPARILASCEALAQAGRMKIATFHINNVNKRLPNLMA